MTGWIASASLRLTILREMSRDHCLKVKGAEPRKLLRWGVTGKEVFLEGVEYTCLRTLDPNLKDMFDKALYLGRINQKSHKT